MNDPDIFVWFQFLFSPFCELEIFYVISNEKIEDEKENRQEQTMVWKRKERIEHPEESVSFRLQSTDMKTIPQA